MGMFDSRKKSKIKNIKIKNWRMELGAFSYEIKYRPGADNMAADALTRDPISKDMCDSYVWSSKRNVDELKKLHVEMCCPGVKRLYHLVKTRNLPFSLSVLTMYVKTAELVVSSSQDFIDRKKGR